MPTHITPKNIESARKRVAVRKKITQRLSPVQNITKLRLALISRKAKTLDAERQKLSVLLKKATDKNFMQISSAIEKNLIETQRLRDQRNSLLEKKVA